MRCDSRLVKTKYKIEVVLNLQDNMCILLNFSIKSFSEIYNQVL